MTFKFGLLVILLVQESAFAAKRQPSLSDIGAADAMQILKQLRIRSLRMPHSKVRNPLSNESVGLINFSDEDCAWDYSSGECTLSISGMRKLVKKSDTGLAKILLERFNCVKQTDKKSCDKRMRCVSDVDGHDCENVDVRRGHEDSPCAKAAPLLFDYYEARVLCEKIESRKSCKTNKQCDWWVLDYGFCVAKFDYIVFGVDKFPKKLEKVVDRALKAEYTALQSSDNFTWQSLLDYKPRGIDCPSDIKPVVCKLIVAVHGFFISRSFYCSGKYESSTDCRKDDLCVWNATSAECELDEEVVADDAFLLSLRVRIGSMPEGIGKRLLEAAFACSGILEEESCYGKCIWEPMDGECQVRHTYLVAVLTEPGKNSTDALCKYLAATGFSGCEDRLIKEDCRQTQFCGWKEGTCEPTEEYYLSKAAELDPVLMEKYFQVKWRCCGGNGTVQLPENRIRKTYI